MSMRPWKGMPFRLWMLKLLCVEMCVAILWLCLCTFEVQVIKQTVTFWINPGEKSPMHIMVWVCSWWLTTWWEPYLDDFFSKTISRIMVFVAGLMFSSDSRPSWMTTPGYLDYLDYLLLGYGPPGCYGHSRRRLDYLFIELHHHIQRWSNWEHVRCIRFFMDTLAVQIQTARWMFSSTCAFFTAFNFLNGCVVSAKMVETRLALIPTAKLVATKLALTGPVAVAVVVALVLVLLAFCLQAWWRREIVHYMSDAFVKHWAVPPDDAVITAFHGTTEINAKAIAIHGFVPSTGGMLGRGVYFSRDPAKVLGSRYGGWDGQILQLQIRLGKVYRVQGRGDIHQYDWSDTFDTAWVPARRGMVASEMEEGCVLDPQRITFVSAWSKRQVLIMLIAVYCHELARRVVLLTSRVISVIMVFNDLACRGTRTWR